MNAMNICMCGVQDGYRHLESCPFPYFGNDLKRQEEWIKAHNELREHILNPITPEAIEFGKKMRWFEIWNESGESEPVDE